MSTEDLMKPRYKVVSDWPGRKDFEVNQIVVLDKEFSPQYQMYEIEDCQGKRQYINCFFEMFPLQFQILKWWEYREELPDFVKSKTGEVFMFHKLHPKGHKALIENMTVDQHYEYLETLLPATSLEYNEYISKK